VLPEPLSEYGDGAAAGGDRPQPVEPGGHVVTEAGVEYEFRVHGHRLDTHLGVAGGLFEGRGDEGELDPAVGGEGVVAWWVIARRCQDGCADTWVTTFAARPSPA
jgi:hypothetical protein